MKERGIYLAAPARFAVVLETKKDGRLMCKRDLSEPSKSARSDGDTPDPESEDIIERFGAGLVGFSPPCSEAWHTETGAKN